ncbi:MAG: UDP-N-acetylglucosamine 1-carboxyvinyltransferase [Balneolaceae bacterium]|nr:UDP-N-acetylglucosamine 1-carboxyvinyltransferase [Balneolaceae bacterium]
MDKFVIHGPTPIHGELHVSGSKNAALPLMAACLLSEQRSEIRNVPRLQDITTFTKVIEGTGTQASFHQEENRWTCDGATLHTPEASYDLVRKMRASFYMLGALLGRCGEARVSLPGGCAWGPRPVDLHLKGLEAMGYSMTQNGGYIEAKGPANLPPSSFTLQPSSVGATINLILAAVLRSESFRLVNAALEPDVVQFCKALQAMGADIEGIGTSTLTVRKVEQLQGLDWDNSPDRIEAGTFMIAAMMHPDSVCTIHGIRRAELGGLADDIRLTGAICEFNSEGTSVRVKAPERITPISVRTDIYPGFPTDLQAQWATMLTQAHGTSAVEDRIYEDRFSYAPELGRLGAEIEVKHNVAWVTGHTPLNGASVMSTDLRASVSLVMAAMVAQGQTDVLRVYHLDRGYEALETKLTAIGANIERVKE